MLQAYAVSDPGAVRLNNQDTFRIIPELGLYLLADGMGGARGGERASGIAVDVVAETLARSPRRDAAALIGAVEEANRRVFSEAARDPNLEGMGTTLVAALETSENDLAIVSVGDSRAYLMSAGGLRAVTEDQSWVQEVGRPLGLDEESLRAHPMRHVLTMAIGVGHTVRVRYYAVQIAEGDLLMLSSDGLHGVVEDREIHRMLAGDLTLEAKCSGLIGAAHEAGSPDNVTVLLIQTSGQAAQSSD
ncbi:MAG: protein phosphatase 2C domain-containing protein [Terriglobia bacterium]